jgi:hypothetical protein
VRECYWRPINYLGKRQVAARDKHCVVPPFPAPPA